jgi:hypothetical protein
MAQRKAKIVWDRNWIVLTYIALIVTVILAILILS